MILANRKESNKQSLSEKIYIFYLAITYFSTIHVSVFKVFSMYTDYVCLFFLLFMILSKGTINIRDLLRIVSALAVFSLLVYLNKGGVGSVITILSAYLMFLAFPKEFTDKGKREIIFFASIFIFFAFYRSFFYRADWYYHRFNDVNPNTMGMYVLYSMAILVSFLDLRRLNNKILIFVCLVISLVSLLNYEARACLIATVLVMCVLLPICRKINKKILFFVILLIVLLGTAFPFIYVNFYRQGINLTFLNKTLYTGREIIWDNMFSLFEKNKNSFVIGLGSHIGDGSINIHNNYFAVIVNFVLIGYFFYYSFLLWRVRAVLLHSKKNEDMRCILIFVVVVFVLGFTEVSSLWSVIYPFAYLFILIPSSSQKVNVCIESREYTKNES